MSKAGAYRCAIGIDNAKTTAAQCAAVVFDSALLHVYNASIWKY